ncbi:MAG: PrsW family glutamic-type intramembrane protease [Anaerolineae bacterium]|nr:PrsW family glutamic-type intramembrane protease [Thermoflexales bacterium]MDW8406237.1 PrsW family glutamic-type intramembrane protease [Anaerolineae bacterium]
MSEHSSTSAGLDRYAKTAQARSSVWRSAIITLVVLLVFVAAVVAIDAALQPQLAGIGLLAVGIVLALAPAILWLIFFYLQDRVEPEPVGHVARMFVIGLALAGAIGIPLTDQVFRTQDWLFRDIGSTLIGTVFVRGAIETFIVYATVRYFMFDSSEFDERTDGVIYGMAAGLGYATASNLQFILSSGGTALGGAEVYVAEVALAYAAFGGLLGYFLGHAKMQQDPVWWLPLGFILTAALNGLFLTLRGQLESGSISVGAQAGGLPTVTGLLLSGALAVIVTAIVAWLINRDVSAAEKGQVAPAAGDPTIGDRQANLATIVVFAAMLLVGVIGWNGTVNGVSAFEQNGIRGAYPAHFSLATGAGDVLRVADRTGTGTEFVIRKMELPAGRDVKAVSSMLAAERAANNVLYKVVRTGNANVNGKAATVQEFAWVDQGGLTGAVPQVIQGIDYIFVVDNTAIVVTMIATPDTIGVVQPQFESFVSSLLF